MDKLLGLLGLAHKGRQLLIGEEPVKAAAQAGHARLILLAADAAENSQRRATQFAALHQTPLLHLPYDKATLGGALGRATCAMLATSDARLALSIARAAGLAEEDPTIIELAALAQRFTQRLAKPQALRRRANKT